MHRGAGKLTDFCTGDTLDLLFNGLGNQVFNVFWGVAKVDRLNVDIRDNYIRKLLFGQCDELLHTKDGDEHHHEVDGGFVFNAPGGGPKLLEAFGHVFFDAHKNSLNMSVVYCHPELAEG